MALDSALDADGGSGDGGDAWRTALGTGAGYGLVLLVVFLLLFVVPYLVFLAL